MTNNDELALKLKEAAEKYNVPGMNITDYLDAEVEYFSHSIPANILALLAERDADKIQLAELEALTAEQDKRLVSYASIATKNASEARTVSVKLPKPHAHLILIQAGHGPDDYWDDVAVSHSLKDRCCDGSERYPVYSIFEIQDACAAAGIKLEVGE